MNVKEAAVVFLCPAPAATLHQDATWSGANLQTTRPKALETLMGSPFCRVPNSEDRERSSWKLFQGSSGEHNGGTQALENSTVAGETEARRRCLTPQGLAGR